MYTDIPLLRQKEIIKIASRKRRRLTAWQNEKIESFKLAIDKKKELTEQQLFFMKGISETLIAKGWL